jgi:hypothetical protein
MALLFLSTHTCFLNTNIHYDNGLCFRRAFSGEWYTQTWVMFRCISIQLNNAELLSHANIATVLYGSDVQP